MIYCGCKIYGGTCKNPATIKYNHPGCEIKYSCDLPEHSHVGYCNEVYMSQLEMEVESVIKEEGELVNGKGVE